MFIAPIEGEGEQGKGQVKSLRTIVASRGFNVKPS